MENELITWFESEHLLFFTILTLVTSFSSFILIIYVLRNFPCFSQPVYFLLLLDSCTGIIASIFLLTSFGLMMNELLGFEPYPRDGLCTLFFIGLHFGHFTGVASCNGLGALRYWTTKRSAKNRPVKEKSQFVRITLVAFLILLYFFTAAYLVFYKFNWPASICIEFCKFGNTGVRQIGPARAIFVIPVFSNIIMFLYFSIKLVGFIKVSTTSVNVISDVQVCYALIN